MCSVLNPDCTWLWRRVVFRCDCESCWLRCTSDLCRRVESIAASLQWLRNETMEEPMSVTNEPCYPRICPQEPRQPTNTSCPFLLLLLVFFFSFNFNIFEPSVLCSSSCCISGFQTKSLKCDTVCCFKFSSAVGHSTSLPKLLPSPDSQEKSHVAKQKNNDAFTDA